MQELLAEASGFSAAVIRVWEENRPAMHLYRKMGFRPIAAITQTKRYSPEEAFEMRKIYLHRSLESD
jgi:ribosomal protein S18 acetylase RimI-like enzyme